MGKGAPLKVVCLDIEGGYGGSSRSLYYALKAMDRDQVRPTVWCRRDGPVVPLYRELDIPVQIASDLPKASSLPRASRNLYQQVQLLQAFLQSSQTRNTLKRAVAEADLVHFNHEGYAGLASWLRRATGRPATMHIRTNVQTSWFARAQMRMISRSVDHVAFITPNEERTFRNLGGSAPGTIIFNPVELPSPAIVSDLPSRPELLVASIANAAWVRGTDRLLDVAEALRSRGNTSVHFLAAGKTELEGRWPSLETGMAAGDKTMQAVAARRGLDGYFTFFGYVDHPQTILYRAHMLIKPTREANPWGRDILEAMAAGKPVYSVGTDTTFLENGRTGFLQQHFDAQRVADDLIALSADRTVLQRLGEQARARVADLCNPAARAADLLGIWQRVARR